LISSGHSFSEIRDYSIPQIILFQSLIINRWEKQHKAAEEASKSGKKRDKRDKGDEDNTLVVSSYRELHGKRNKRR